MTVTHNSDKSALSTRLGMRFKMKTHGFYLMKMKKEVGFGFIGFFPNRFV